MVNRPYPGEVWFDQTHKKNVLIDNLSVYGTNNSVYGHYEGRHQDSTGRWTRVQGQLGDLLPITETVKLLFHESV